MENKNTKTYRYNILIGVAPFDFDINKSSFDSYGWYLSCDDLKLYSGPPHNYNGKKTNLQKIKEEVIVIMNTKKRTLNFKIGNEDNEDCYTNITLDIPITPAVFLCDENDSIKITEL